MTMNFISKTLLIIICGFLIASCSVQKRRYMQGYYVHNSKHEKNIASIKPGVPAIEVRENQEAKTLISNSNAGSSVPAIQRLKVAEPDTCDKLVFRDGSELTAKITEVNSSEIKYRRCDSPNGPIYSTRKSDLFMVTYSDGRKEVLPAEPERTREVPYTPPSRSSGRNSTKAVVTEPHAIPAMVMGLLSFFSLVFSPFIPFAGILLGPGAIVLAVLAIRAARAAKKAIDAEPDKYAGSGYASTGLTFAIITLTLVGIALIITAFVLLFILLFI